MVGLRGIEPRLQAPHARVLPLYYSPHFFYCKGKKEKSKWKTKITTKIFNTSHKKDYPCTILSRLTHISDK